MSSENDQRQEIVVGFDGSEGSERALAWASRQAEMTGWPLRIVMAWDWPRSLGWPLPLPTDYHPSVEAEKLVANGKRTVEASHPAVSVDSSVVEGPAGIVLVESSKQASLIVVGCRGHGEFVGMLLGSVGTYVATHAECPVVVYRDPNV